MAISYSPNGMDVNQMMNPDAEKDQKEAEEVEKEDKIENDDEETLEKARAWDDWKDGEVFDNQAKLQYYRHEIEVSSKPP